MNNRLIVVRAGDSSLHPAWLKSEPNRQWHLHISYYGRRADPYELPPQVSLSRDVGQKWIGLLSCLKENPELLNYKYIAFPDDDLKMATGSWDGIFDTAETSNADICQPSLDHRSFYWHDVTLNRKWLDYREVDFIELMSPVFKVNFLHKIMPFFDENKSSLGLDYLWSHIANLENRKMVITDKSVVLHTREIGKGSQYNGLNPADEMKKLYLKYNIYPRRGKSILAYKNNKVFFMPNFALNRKEISPRLFKLMKKFMRLEVVG